jgi:site-specific DNA recombinase
MTPSGVRQLLRNRVYLGELHKRSYVNREAHPAILDAATFEAVQQKLAQNTRPPRSEMPTALLSGLVYCASCGHVMTRNRPTGGPVYTCTKNHSGEICPGPAAINCKNLDDYVRPVALAELAKLQVEATEGDNLKPIEARLEDARIEKREYLKHTKIARVGAEAYNEGLDERIAIEDAILAELATERARRPVLPVDGNAAAVFEDLSPHDQNTVLRGLLAGVVVRRAGRGKRIAVEDRARVIASGHDVGRPKRKGGEASGIVALPFPDAHAVGVLGIASA